MQGKGEKTPKLKIFSIYTHVSGKDEDMVMMSMKPFTEIVKYMSTWSGVLALGWGQFKKCLLHCIFLAHVGGGGGVKRKRLDYYVYLEISQ